MDTLGFTIGKKFTFTTTAGRCYLFAGLIGDFFPAHVNEVLQDHALRHPAGPRLPHLQPVLHRERHGGGGQRAGYSGHGL